MTYATLAGATVRLTVVSGELDRREFVFGERTTCVLGRSRGCDPRLPDDNRHAAVSRHHCLLDINPPAARVRDLGSRNGIANLTAKVSDFGLAKAFDDSGLSGLTTRTGQAAGKPRYLARHQVLHFKDASPAVDVWATAACLYEALTGATPRTFARKQDVWRVVLQQDAVPIRDRAPSVPPRLAEVIDTALRERPYIGFQSAGAFRDALLKTELGYDEFSRTWPAPGVH